MSNLFCDNSDNPMDKSRARDFVYLVMAALIVITWVDVHDIPSSANIPCNEQNDPTSCPFPTLNKRPHSDDDIDDSLFTKKYKNFPTKTHELESGVQSCGIQNDTSSIHIISVKLSELKSMIGPILWLICTTSSQRVSSHQNQMSQKGYPLW